MNRSYGNRSNDVLLSVNTTTLFGQGPLQTDPNLYALHHQQQQFNLQQQQTKKKVRGLDVMKRSYKMAAASRFAYVEAVVDINAVAIESIWYSNTPQQQQESRVSPVVPLRTFIQEVLKRSRTTYSTLQTALYYLFRARSAIKNQLLSRQQGQKKSNWQYSAYISCGRRMFLASLVVASKFVQDKTYRNSAWAKIAGLPVTEINTAERYFLNLLDYRLYIDQPSFDHWHRTLHIRTQARMHGVPIDLDDLSNYLSFELETPPAYPSSPTKSLFSSSSSSSIASLTLESPYLPPALSSTSSSISSSPAQTPPMIKRKLEADDHTTSIMNKKHCRLWH